MPASILDWGIQFILSLQGSGDSFAGLMNLFTFLGNEDFFLLLFPFLYWCVDSSLGIRMGVYLVLSIGVNNLLKTAFTDPRPYWYDARVALWTGAESTFGIPSGHAQNSVVIWGGLASQMRQRWGWVVAGVLAFMVGFSRILLGTHFPTDVLAGWLLGIVVLILAVRYEKSVVAKFNLLGMGQKIGLILAISLGAIFLHALIVQWVVQSFALPTAWVETARMDAPDDPIAPLSISGMVTIMAAAFGFLSGVVWLEPRGGFVVSGNGLIRGARFLLGIVGVMILRYGLDALFSMITSIDDSFLGYLLRFVRYGAIGFWMSALAPLVFVRLNLAEKKEG